MLTWGPGGRKDETQPCCEGRGAQAAGTIQQRALAALQPTVPRVLRAQRGQQGRQGSAAPRPHGERSAQERRGDVGAHRNAPGDATPPCGAGPRAAAGGRQKTTAGEGRGGGTAATPQPSKGQSGGGGSTGGGFSSRTAPRPLACRPLPSCRPHHVTPPPLPEVRGADPRRSAALRACAAPALPPRGRSERGTMKDRTGELRAVSAGRGIIRGAPG